MKRRAEVVFTERPFSGHGLPGWSVALVNRPDVRDEQAGGKPVDRRWFASIAYARPYGSLDGYGEPTPEGEPYRYSYTLQGGHPGGRRYNAAPTVTEAQQAVAKWARRRFFYED